MSMRILGVCGFVGENIVELKIPAVPARRPEKRIGLGVVFNGEAVQW